MPAAASTGARRLPAPRVEPKGRWGVWLAAQRTARGLPQKQVFDGLRKGWPDLFPWHSETSLDSYRAFEKGLTTPDANQEAAFLAYFKGAEAPPVGSTRDNDTSTPVGLDLLYAKLDAQAEAISALADQVKALAQAQPTGEDLANVLAGAVALAIRETLLAAGLADGPRPK